MDTLRPKRHYKVITNNLPVPINTRTGDKYACGTLASVPGSHKLGGGGGEENLVNIVCTCSVSPTHPQFSRFLEISMHERLFSVYSWLSLWINKIAALVDH